MKTIFLCPIFVLFIALSINSCKKDDSSTPAPAPVVQAPMYSCSCKINGVAKSGSAKPYFNKYDDIVTIFLFFDNSLIQLVSPAAQCSTSFTGTNIMSGSLNIAATTCYHTNYTGGSGSMVISSYSDSLISGTYKFFAKTINGTDSVRITDGVFTDIPKE